tara:strand:- start:376 stop:1506 length:1131 start_codon:yes stop_codon:yes gene_type:complete
MFFKAKILDWRLLLGCSLGIIFLYVSLPSDKEVSDFDELALGTENIVMLGKVDDLAIHCHDLNDFDNCLSSYEKGGDERPVLLWLGNSQLHAINQYKSGDETAAPELHRRFQEQGDYFLTLSQPNASLLEHYLLFAFALNRLPVTMLALPVVFDDMREDGIRENLIDALKDQDTVDLLYRTTIGQQLISNYGDKDAAGNEMAALEDTFQESSEKLLNAKLEEIWPIWANRSTLRGNSINMLYQFRNWSLGINPSSSRKIIPGRYKKNKNALIALLELANEQGVEVLLYIVPLRNDVKIPYEAYEYSSFKTDIADIANKNNTQFVDLENLVPSELWGTKDSTTIGGNQELDFMHFQEGGHRLLAEKLFQELSLIKSD